MIYKHDTNRDPIFSNITKLMMAYGNIPPPEPRNLSELGLNVTLNLGSISPKYLGDRIRFQVELPSYHTNSGTSVLLC